MLQFVVMFSVGRSINFFFLSTIQAIFFQQIKIVFQKINRIQTKNSKCLQEKIGLI